MLSGACLNVYWVGWTGHQHSMGYAGVSVVVRNRQDREAPGSNTAGWPVSGLTASRPTKQQVPSTSAQWPDDDCRVCHLSLPVGLSRHPRLHSRRTDRMASESAKPAQGFATFRADSVDPCRDRLWRRCVAALDGIVQHPSRTTSTWSEAAIRLCQHPLRCPAAIARTNTWRPAPKRTSHSSWSALATPG